MAGKPGEWLYHYLLAVADVDVRDDIRAVIKGQWKFNLHGGSVAWISSTNEQLHESA